MDVRSPLPFYMPPLSLPTGGKFGRQHNPMMNIVRFFTCRTNTCTFRIRGVLGARCCVVSTICAFIVIFYCCLSYLPEQSYDVGDTGVGGKLGAGQKIGRALKGVLKYIPQPDDEFILPRPMIPGVTYNRSVFRHDVHRDDAEDEDPHLIRDREKFRQAVDGQIPKPKSDDELQKLDRDRVRLQQGEPISGPGYDEENERRRDMIKNMTIFAWDNYKKYAWGANELKPLSKLPHHSSVFGSSNLGATIVDSLDTLYIMGLLDRFDEGRTWVEMSFDFTHSRGDLSVFETTIRFIGGFLSCYTLTGDKLFKEKAETIAKLLLPAFDTPTGIPYALVNVHSHSAKNYAWASGGASILSEFGTLSLEFEYLSVITGNPIFSQKVRKIREMLNSLEKENGFHMNYLHPKTGNWGSRHVSIGALGDSFYEYLIKSWLITNKQDTEALIMYEQAIQAFESKLFFRSQKDNLFYIAEMRGSRIDHKVDHLACFAGGMFALYAANTNNATSKKYWFDIAEDFAYTCHESYIRTATKLGPESFRFTNEFSAVTINEREKYYILRPEVLETWFYLWRLTKKQRYRDWAWDAAQAIEKYCKTAHGYSGIKNVYDADPSHDDVQQSFFLAETLKYFYLIFSPDDLLPLDKWVFNTEAHPLPVRFDQAANTPDSVNNNNNINNNVGEV